MGRYHLGPCTLTEGPLYLDWSIFMMSLLSQQWHEPWFIETAGKGIMGCQSIQTEALAHQHSAPLLAGHRMIRRLIQWNYSETVISSVSQGPTGSLFWLPFGHVFIVLRKNSACCWLTETYKVIREHTDNERERTIRGNVIAGFACK